MCNSYEAENKLPSEHLTLGVEYVTRHTDTPYFSGIVRF
jgi:hypothetical protein